MNERQRQLWIDTLSGMQNRATQIIGDDDTDRRNRNWYARKIYGDHYEVLREYFQQHEMNRIQ